MQFKCGSDHLWEFEVPNNMVLSKNWFSSRRAAVNMLMSTVFTKSFIVFIIFIILSCYFLLTIQKYGDFRHLASISVFFLYCCLANHGNFGQIAQSRRFFVQNVNRIRRKKQKTLPFVSLFAGMLYLCIAYRNNKKYEKSSIGNHLFLPHAVADGTEWY